MLDREEIMRDIAAKVAEVNLTICETLADPDMPLEDCATIMRDSLAKLATYSYNLGLSTYILANTDIDAEWQKGF